MNSQEESQRADHVELHCPDYVELALNASCAALMALDRVRMHAADDERVTGRVSLAIAALRHAIVDLRAPQASGESVAVHGFVADGRLDDGHREGEVGRPARFRALP